MTSSTEVPLSACVSAKAICSSVNLFLFMALSPHKVQRARESCVQRGLVRRVRTIAAEDTFGVPLPDENLERFQTVGDVIDYIRDPMIAA
jgi:hypothetical protein